MKINILDSNVIDKIAAGEVVERPASVIKELVENSIDAKASSITVEIKEGGKKLIRVTDNGIGIESSEVKKAFIRHATSKIETEEDLNGIISLGFRGEALASIAAVSQVELITKTKDQTVGRRVVIKGGEFTIDEECGAPDGTTLIASELFYNVPARKKFMKSDTTETSEITEIVSKLALAHPEIAFKLISNGKAILHTAGDDLLKNAIYYVYGKELTKEIVDIDEVQNEIKVSGFIGRPVIQRATRIYENFFVNGRYIKSRVLEEAVEEAFYGYVMKGKFPFCVLSLEIEPELIDINVHPAKTEIRFKDENLVYETVTKIIKNKLAGLDNSILVSLKTSMEEKLERAEEIKEQREESSKAPDAMLSPNKFLDKKKENIKDDIKEVTKEETEDIIKTIFTQSTLYDESNSIPSVAISSDEAEYEDATNALPLRDYKVIGQLFNTYFLVEEGENFYLIDQHAAKEKVNYELLKKAYENKSVNSQVLLEPIIVNVTGKEKEVIDSHIEEINRFGFDIEEFGPDSFRIKEVPFIFEKIPTEEMFHEMIDELLDKKLSKELKTFDDMFATVACKASLKANDKQSVMEGESLIRQLMELENPFNCPHGRPVIVALTKYEIEKKFKRII
ncbi:MAG: DNA mismatch repair endonuclease MutL [Clostridia bacterium]|nr:DNA mismatch repair endonuclease MutL [Clostridia bacterium]